MIGQGLGAGMVEFPIAHVVGADRPEAGKKPFLRPLQKRGGARPSSRLNAMAGTAGCPAATSLWRADFSPLPLLPGVPSASQPAGWLCPGG